MSTSFLRIYSKTGSLNWHWGTSDRWRHGCRRRAYKDIFMACRWRHNDNKLPEQINGYLAFVQYLLIQRHNFYGVVKDDCILTCLI